MPLPLPFPDPNGRPGLQLVFGDHGLFQGYPGPAIGTPEWQAAVAAGQHPLRDWLQQQRQQRQANRPQIPGAGQGPFPNAPPMLASALGEVPHTMAPASTTGYGADPMAARTRRPTPVIAR